MKRRDTPLQVEVSHEHLPEGLLRDCGMSYFVYADDELTPRLRVWTDTSYKKALQGVVASAQRFFHPVARIRVEIGLPGRAG
jgi:hypothetical protein